MPSQNINYKDHEIEKVIPDSLLETVANTGVFQRVKYTDIDEVFNFIGKLPNDGIRPLTYEIPHIEIDVDNFCTFMKENPQINQNSEIIFSDDIAMNRAAILSIRDICVIFECFINVPGHKYIIDINKKWIIFVAWENYIHFVTFDANLSEITS